MVRALAEIVGGGADCFAEKQTVEFNLNIRANFKKTVRARMGEACPLFLITGVALTIHRRLGGHGAPEHPRR